MNFTVSKKSQIISLVLVLIGVVALGLGIADEHADAQRIWVNIFVNSFFFFAISLSALFFIAVQYAAEAAWAVALKRLFEAIASYLPIGAIFLIIVFAAGSMHKHHIWHWMDNAVTHDFVEAATLDTAHPVYSNEGGEGMVKNEEFDQLIANKTPYLNQAFWWGRSLFYIAGFLLFGWYIRKKSLEEDEVGGTGIHKKNIAKSAGFLVFFAYTSSTLSWDWLMSIDTHWFSTLYGWYVFSGMWISFILFTLILIKYLKSRGLLEYVNESHIHDMGKWTFAISFLWSYLWFSQFMLIWYSDIPEEVVYYIPRVFGDYKEAYLTMFAINFILPMVLLMARDTKRNWSWLLPIVCILFLSHWVDTFILIAPGAGLHFHIGFLEIGVFLGFLGIFSLVVLRALSKRPLLVKNHPYLEESLHLHT